MKEVTIVLTACDRLDLLERTLKSFVEFNSYPIKKLLIRDDCGLGDVWQHTKCLLERLELPFPFELLPCEQVGQAKSLDMMMEKVETDYVFHLEDDWEFYESGFIEKSIKILDVFPKITQVWIRGSLAIPSVNYGKEQLIGGVSFRFVLRSKETSGYTCNPNLIRKKDVVKFIDFLSAVPDGMTERKIGDYYFALGFKSAWLIEGYCRHIGDEKSTYRPETIYREGARKL